MLATPEKNYTSATTAPAESERRRFPRLPFQEAVTILWAGPQITGVGRNLSGNGMLFSVERVGAVARGLVVGYRLRLWFYLPRTAERDFPVNVIGEIVRVSDDDRPDRLAVAVNF